MRKANGILVFGMLFVILSLVYWIVFINIPFQDPSQEMIIKREGQIAFQNTTFWSGIILIAISIFLRIKAKINKE